VLRNEWRRILKKGIVLPVHFTRYYHKYFHFYEINDFEISTCQPAVAGVFCLKQFCAARRKTEKENRNHH
jgi:hypothetical protein